MLTCVLAGRVVGAWVQGFASNGWRSRSAHHIDRHEVTYALSDLGPSPVTGLPDGFLVPLSVARGTSEENERLRAENRALLNRIGQLIEERGGC